MADPLTVLGSVAAGAQLFGVAASALLSTIRLVKQLRDIPKKLSATLDDAEKSTSRVHYICDHMLQPGSNVFRQLETQQLDNLSQIANELHQATEVVCGALAPLVEPWRSGKQNKVQRLWKSVISLTKEKEIAEKLERITRLNDELLRELGMASLELQASVAQTLGSVAADLRDGQARLVDVVGHNHDDLRVNMDSHHHTTTGRLVDIHSSISQTQQTVLHIQGSLAAISSPQGTHNFIRQEATETRAEIRQLRNEILSLVTGASARLSVESRQVSSSLCPEDHITVQRQVCRQLLTYPGSLVDAIEGRMARRVQPRHCRCRASTRSRGAKFWNVWFRGEEINEHLPGCRYFKSGGRVRTYSTRGALSPLLNGAVEFAISVTTGPGFWSIAPGLRYHAAVKRSCSPIFQAFDRLPSLCVREVIDENQAWDPDEEFSPRPAGSHATVSTEILPHILPDFQPPSYEDDQYRGPYHLIWDMEEVGSQLENLCRQIRSAHQQGDISAYASDEQGRTTLFGFFQLLLVFHRQHDMLSTQFCALFQAIVASGVDLSAQAFLAESEFVEYLPCTFDRTRDYHLNSLGRPISAWDQYFLAADFSNDYFAPAAQHTAMSYFLDFAADYISLANESARIDAAGQWREKLLGLVNYPELAEAFGMFNDLELAVIRRSLPDVKRLIARDHEKAYYTAHSQDRTRPDILELALEWPPGLRCLVAANYPVNNALVAARRLVQSEAIAILMETPQPLFSTAFIMHANHESRSFMDCLFDRNRWESRPAKIDVILPELVRRRTSLKQLAIDSLSLFELAQLEINQSDMLDATAEATYRSLTRVTTVPEALDCWVSPYHSTNVHVVKHFDLLYDAGFKAVDIPDRNGHTPLVWTAGNCIVHTNELLWLLSRGARVDWTDMPDPDGIRYPSVLFYWALIYRHHLSGSPEEWLSERTAISKYVPANLQMVPDGCCCACGTRGCLAIHLLWRCNHRNCRCNFQNFRDMLTDRLARLQSWLSDWPLSNEDREFLYAETTRLELFERLGMAHTCCCNSINPGKRTIGNPRICPDAEEIAQLRDEDADLTMQLEDLMDHYHSARAIHGGRIEAFLSLWWQIVEEILPPLLPVEACKKRLLGYWEQADKTLFVMLDHQASENRTEREKQTLIDAGYVGDRFKDFREVILVHFAGRDWSPAQPDSLENESWETCSSDADSEASEADPESQLHEGLHSTLI